MLLVNVRRIGRRLRNNRFVLAIITTHLIERVVAWDVWLEFPATEIATTLTTAKTPAATTPKSTSEHSNRAKEPLDPRLQNQHGNFLLAELIHHLDTHIAVLVVDLPLGGIRENGVGIVNLLEPRIFVRIISPSLVRMELEGQLSVCPFYVILIRCLFYLQNLVQVPVFK